MRGWTCPGCKARYADRASATPQRIRWVTDKQAETVCGECFETFTTTDVGYGVLAVPAPMRGLQAIEALLAEEVYARD